MNEILRESFFTFVSLLIIVLASCSGMVTETQPGAGEVMSTATIVPDGSGSDSELEETKWQLIAMGSIGSEQALIEGSEITLIFENETSAGGTSGCNTYGGEYNTNAENRIAFLNIFSTAMACEAAGLMDQEQAFLNALQNAESFDQTPQQLSITYNSGQSRLLFGPIE